MVTPTDFEPVSYQPPLVYKEIVVSALYHVEGCSSPFTSTKAAASAIIETAITGVWDSVPPGEVSPGMVADRLVDIWLGIRGRIDGILLGNIPTREGEGAP